MNGVAFVCGKLIWPREEAPTSRGSAPWPVVPKMCTSLCGALWRHRVIYTFILRMRTSDQLCMWNPSGQETPRRDGLRGTRSERPAVTPRSAPSFAAAAATGPNLRPWGVDARVNGQLARLATPRPHLLPSTPVTVAQTVPAGGGGACMCMWTALIAALESRAGWSGCCAHEGIPRCRHLPPAPLGGDGLSHSRGEREWGDISGPCVRLPVHVLWHQLLNVYERR